MFVILFLPVHENCAKAVFGSNLQVLKVWTGFHTDKS